jgi:SET domain-containing protein
MPHYTHLSHIDFESSEERQEVWRLGMEAWERKEVTSEADQLGKQFIKKIEEGYIPAVSVRFINNQVDCGLFAEESLEGRCYVGEYTGVVRKNDRRYLEPLNNYCYTYPVLDEIGRNYVIDATKGNLTRFINHSYTPNLQPIYVFYEGFFHLIFLAIRRIEKGEQLFYNYGQNYWKLRDSPL